MNFSIFYDNRPAVGVQRQRGDRRSADRSDVRRLLRRPGPGGYHNGAIYSDPRIAMYMGMGLHQMPGDVWWRTWRTLPPQQCSTDPDFSWQGQPAAQGYWTTITDPQSHKQFRVWEGHYTYPGTSLTFMPTYGGGMFEGLMANDVVPETTWGPRSFGLADERIVQVQIKYATQQLGYPVWGMSPSSTADDTGDYNAFGAQGLAFPTGEQLAQGPCPTCTPSPETTVTPHASFLALAVAPQAAYANIAKLRTLYPGIYTLNGGFYDAVNPTTGDGRAPAAGAGPIDDHGLARQRAGRRPDAALVRRRSGVVGRPHLPRRRDDVVAVSWPADLMTAAEADDEVDGAGDDYRAEEVGQQGVAQRGGADGGLL